MTECGKSSVKGRQNRANPVAEKNSVFWFVYRRLTEKEMQKIVDQQNFQRK